jgi:hypothetical protein
VNAVDGWLLVHQQDSPCTWPFHHSNQCGECREWDAKYGENLDDYLSHLSEIRESRKAALRAARDATAGIIEPTGNV